MQVVDAQNDLLLHYIHFKKYSSILKIKKKLLSIYNTHHVL